MSELTKRKFWNKLIDHKKLIDGSSIYNLFDDDPDRFKRFSIEDENLLFDFSKNIIDENTLRLFENLLDEIKIKEKIKSLFDGIKINTTEKRQVLHPLLRGSFTKKTKNLYEKEVLKSLLKIKKISDSFFNERKLGYSGKKIKNIVNIGIGGSDLGPKLICDALDKYSNQNLNVFFISNIDPTNLSKVLSKVSPENTIFIISSKSFGTIETLKNAKACKKWFIKKSSSTRHYKEHFFAVTSNFDKAKQLGIESDNILKVWEWVGGRYSLWSSVGLPISIKIGYNNFTELLDGAKYIDHHFTNKPFKKNIPMIMGCIGVWYNNFFNSETHAILPYDENLKYLPPYLQQADMESNGKYITKDGNEVNYQTGQIIWGDRGTNGQHAFYQLIHQGTKIIPCDFIGFSKSLNEYDNLHEILLSNLVGQTMALMKGKKVSKDMDISDSILLKSKSFMGNKPSNTLIFDKLTPRNLGKLIAIYEHKIFIQGCIWDINSFDQWGVELGKELANDILDVISGNKSDKELDSSSKGQLNFIKKFNT